MIKLLIIFCAFGHSLYAYENLILLAKKRSAFLESYTSYANIAISQVEIPPQTVFLSFKVSAEPFDLSIFGCSPEKVYVYVKKGSIPVLNPDNSIIPLWVRNITKSELHGLHLLTNKEFGYINITSPEQGIYYFAAFFPYVDPDKVAVKPKGLSKHCSGFINILTYISKAKQFHLLTNNDSYQIYSKNDRNFYYEFSKSLNIKEVILKIKNMEISDNSTNVTLRLGCESLPSSNKYIYSKTINALDKNISIPFWLNINGRYYLEFEFNKSQEFEASLLFSLDTVNIDQTFQKRNLQSIEGNKLDSTVHKTGIIDYYEDKITKNVEPYILYELLKESGSESFLYTFNINHEEEKEFMVPIALNLTSENFSVLKFKVEDIIDVGGTLEFSIVQQPPVDRGGVELFPASIDHIIVGCISQDVYQIPSLPRHCMKAGVKNIAPVVINNTVNNSTVLIPFPESGMWYVSIRLFCKPCQNCLCFKKCSNILESCRASCKCDTMYTCKRCLSHCKSEVQKEIECKNCNCDNNCTTSETSCNSSIIFDLSSFPCVMGKCGDNGRCQFNVADGYIFSACRCRNKYKGMACNDDSNATPFWKLILAQVLLTSSNIIMLPCVYIAGRRGYYPEAVMYSFVFLFSSLYHACDVDDYSIQFCITSHASLQFADVFSALLSIWGTMLAISDIDLKYRTTLYVLASILLAYCIVIDRTGIWTFLLVTIPGTFIIGISWYLKFKKSGTFFIKKSYVKFYFSTGIIIMLIGILIFACFQTNGNYMYLHSLWHFVVGLSVVVILPTADTFSPMENL